MLQNYLGAPESFGCARIIWVHQDGNEDIVSGSAESCKEIRSFGNYIYDITHRDMVPQQTLSELEPQALEPQSPRATGPRATVAQGQSTCS